MSFTSNKLSLKNVCLQKLFFLAFPFYSFSSPALVIWELKSKEKKKQQREMQKKKKTLTLIFSISSSSSSSTLDFPFAASQKREEDEENFCVCVFVWIKRKLKQRWKNLNEVTKQVFCGWVTARINQLRNFSFAERCEKTTKVSPWLLSIKSIITLCIDILHQNSEPFTP